jgi:hypothetical protein
VRQERERGKNGWERAWRVEDSQPTTRGSLFTSHTTKINAGVTKVVEYEITDIFILGMFLSTHILKMIIVKTKPLIIKISDYSGVSS